MTRLTGFCRGKPRPFVLRLVAGLLCCLLCRSVLGAETVYVGDTLRVGVRTLPQASATPFNVVVTGMALEVLDRQNGFIKIRTEKGVEGWISEAYTTQNRPALLRLPDVEHQRDALRAELGVAQKTLADDARQRQALVQENRALEKHNAALRSELAQLRQLQANTRVGFGWLFWWLALVPLAIAGFGVGAAWHRSRVTRRLGGLRV